jgi:hypothetical protein
MENFLSQDSLFARVLGLFMVFVYAGVGVLFIFFPDFVFILKGYPRYILGILFIIYSVFRTYRIYKVWRERNEEE